MWNQHHHQQLLIRKKNMKSKKYRSTGNEAEEHNTWCIEKVMGMSMINRSWNQSYLMQKRQLKTIRQGVQVKTYKERG